MTITAGDDVRAVFQYTLSGAAAHQNVYNYHAGSGVSDTDANVMSAIATQLDTAYARMNAQYGTDVNDDECKFSKLDVVTGKWEAIGSVDTAQPIPTGGSSSLPNGVGGVQRYLTPGHGEQGRKFITGWQQQAIIDNTLQAAVLAAFILYGGDVTSFVAVSGGNMEPGWYSEKFATNRNYDGNTLTNTFAAYQRRRRPGVGI